MKGKQQQQQIKKKSTISYVSPYVLQAADKAKARAKAGKDIREIKKNVEWNSDSRTPGLFDPKLKKVEVFRHSPRKPSTSTIDKVLYRRHDNYDISTDIDSTMPLSTTLQIDKSYTSTTPLRAFLRPTPIITDNENYPKYSQSEGIQISPRNLSSSPRNSYSPKNSPRNSYSPRESRSTIYTTTRSTSPINERIVDNILNQIEDGDLNTSIVDLIGEYPGGYQSPNISAFGKSDKNKLNKSSINQDNMMEYMTRMMEAMGEMMNGVNNKKNIVRSRSRSRSRSRNASPNKSKVSYSQDDNFNLNKSKETIITTNDNNDDINISTHTSKSKIIDLVLSRIQALEKTEKEVLRSLSGKSSKSIDNTEKTVTEHKRELQREQRKNHNKNDISVLPNSNSEKRNDNHIKSKFDTILSYKNTKIDDDDDDDNDNNNENKNLENTFILQAPPISETYETSIMGQTQGTKQWEGTILLNNNNNDDDNNNNEVKNTITSELLTLLGNNNNNNNNDRLHKKLSLSERRQIEAIRDLPYLPSLSYDSKLYYDDYVKDLDRIRELKAVPWSVRGMNLVDVSDKLTDKLADDIIDEITLELESFVDDYAEKFIDKI